MTSNFREIGENQHERLKTALESKLPFTTNMLNILFLKMQGNFTADTFVSFFIYLDGRWDNWTDPFVICSQTPNMHGEYCILLHAPESPTPEMISALDNFVSWDKFPLFSAISYHFYENHLESLCLKRGGKPTEHPFEVYALSKDIATFLEKGPRYSYSENLGVVETLPLRKFDVDRIMAIDLYKDWLHAKSREQVELSIKNLPTMGIFVSGQLASFTMFSSVGLMNIVWTEEPFRQRGLALKVLQSLSRAVSDLGMTPMAECPYSDSWRKLLLKTGFRFVKSTIWVRFNPK